MKRKEKQEYYLFSPWLRVWHWTMAICVVVLAWTGLFIGNPGFAGTTGVSPTILVGSFFSMETIRRIHFYAAFILIFAFVFRIYGAVKYPGDRLLPKFGQAIFWKGLIETTKHYLMIPVKHEKEYLRNSLARTSYVVMYTLFFIQIVTGLAMFSMIEPNSWLALVFNPVNLLFGEYNVHIIHHYITWAFILFIIVHVYMGFRADMMEANSEISSMVSGRKYFDEDPADVEDLK